MNQNPAPIGEIADALHAARRDRKPIPPVRDTFGLVDPGQAYEVQDRNTARRLGEGRRPVGRKIGLTSKAVQAQLGVDEPDFGALWDDFAFSDGDTVDRGRFMQPKVEAEIAFVMARRVEDPAASMTDVLRAIAYALQAAEIVDSAIAGWSIKLADTIADNGSGGGFVLGCGPRGVGASTCGSAAPCCRATAPSPPPAPGRPASDTRPTPCCGSRARWPPSKRRWMRATSSFPARSGPWSRPGPATCSRSRYRASPRCTSASPRGADDRRRRDGAVGPARSRRRRLTTTRGGSRWTRTSTAAGAAGGAAKPQRRARSADAPRWRCWRGRPPRSARGPSRSAARPGSSSACRPAARSTRPFGGAPSASADAVALFRAAEAVESSKEGAARAALFERFPPGSDPSALLAFLTDTGHGRCEPTVMGTGHRGQYCLVQYGSLAALLLGLDRWRLREWVVGVRLAPDTGAIDDIGVRIPGLGKG